jgi:hypothetical protein
MTRLLPLTANVSALCLVAGAASAGTVVMNFDSITIGATVDSYYDGGIDSFGEVGPNDGVVFTIGDWSTLSGYGETSQPNFAFSISGAGVVDVASGFTGAVSFTYGAFVDTTVSIYSGLDGTGTLLAQSVLPADNVYAFSPDPISFSGIGESIVISSGFTQFGWDDLTLNVIGFGTPEPATWALMLTGVAGLGAALRSRRRYAST